MPLPVSCTSMIAAVWSSPIRRKFYPTVCRGKLQCVIDNVEQDLLQPICISTHKWHVQSYLSVNLLTVSELLRVIVGLLDNCMYIDDIFAYGVIHECDITTNFIERVASLLEYA
jgi:hypothetical protein